MATKTASKNATQQSTQNRSKQEEGALMDLFVSGLKDINWAEKNLIPALKKMAKAATSEKVAEAFQQHMVQTEGQLERLGAVFASIDKRQVSKKCAAMEGLIEEAEELIEETDDGTEVRDVALIAAAQKVEHYEIASYGTLRTLAATLGLTEAQKLLEQTLEEEKQTDSLLTDIAENYVNEAALEE
jgi:ferritin-like metal-binding protein YciE